MGAVRIRGLYCFLAGLIFAACATAQPISQLPNFGTVSGDDAGDLNASEFVIYCPGCAVHPLYSRNRAIPADDVGDFIVSLTLSALTCAEVDGSPSVNPLDSILFDSADGFTVTDAGSSDARIDWAPVANQITLGTHTVGPYVATIADAGSSRVTVAGSGGEGAAVTLNIPDIFVLNTGDTMTGGLDVQNSTLQASGTGNIISNTTLQAGTYVVAGNALAIAVDYPTDDACTGLARDGDALFEDANCNGTRAGGEFLLSNPPSAQDLTCTDCIGPTEISDLTLGTDTAGDYVATIADGTGIDGTASGEGSVYTPNIDTTELGSRVWGDDSVTPLTLTFNPSGGSSNPLISTENGSISIESGSVGDRSSVEVVDGTSTGRINLKVDVTTRAFLEPSLFTFTVDALLDDGSGDSPSLSFAPQAGTSYSALARDTDDRFVLDASGGNGLYELSGPDLQLCFYNESDAGRKCISYAGGGPLFYDADGDLVQDAADDDLSIDDDVPESGDFGNLTAGRSLAIAAGTIDADQELYEHTKCINVDPSHSTTDWLFFRAERAITVIGIDCIVDAATSVVMTLQECDGDAASCGDTEAAITCGTTNTTEASSIDDASVDAGDWMRVTRGTMTGSPTQAELCVTYTVAD